MQFIELQSQYQRIKYQTNKVIGNVTESFVNIDKSRRKPHYTPPSDIEMPIPTFIEWFIKYHKI